MKIHAILAICFMSSTLTCIESPKYKPLEIKDEKTKKKLLSTIQKRCNSIEKTLDTLTVHKVMLEVDFRRTDCEVECYRLRKREEIERLLFFIENTPDFENIKIKNLKNHINSLIQNIVCKEECWERSPKEWEKVWENCKDYYDEKEENENTEY